MVFVLDQHKKPLMPCTEKRARLLLKRHRAVVHKMAPFTIRLKDRRAEDSVFQPLRLKLDPGSKTTGSALLLEGALGAKAIFFGEIVHKVGIKAKLDARRTVRRGRRQRQTRYRPAQFQNRRRPEGWLPPSLTARVNQTVHVVAKMCRLAPITALSVEHVAFDTQKMQDPEISGVEYQQGTLLGYEVREYLLEKWHRACAYCGQTQVPLEVEHIVPKNRRGSSRISNLAMACHECNATKDNRTAEEFGYPDIQAQARKPLQDAAFMNARRTKKQRTACGLPKEHYFDALCVGKSTPDQFASLVPMVQVWTAKGRGTRQMCRTNAYGFPVAHRSRKKMHFGFQTGDLVKAVVLRGKYAGTWVGRILVRASGRLDIAAHGQRMAQGISYKYCRVLQRQDGWQYEAKMTSA